MRDYPPRFETLPRHPFLKIDAEAVGDAVDVVEITDDFNRVEHVSLGEPDGAKTFDLAPVDLRGLKRQLFGKFAERSLAFAQTRGAIIFFDAGCQLFIFDQPTEILPVRFDSIETIINL